MARHASGGTKRGIGALLLAAGLTATGCASPPPTSVPVAGMEQSVVIEDPRIYQDLFQKIERARFIREGIEP